MEKNSSQWSAGGDTSRRALRRLVTVLVGASLFVLSAFVAVGPAEAADLHVKDRYGRSVRVPANVVVKLSTKHNLKLIAVAVWLPESRLRDSSGTRSVYQITLVKVECRTFPLVGRLCWRTNERVALRSVVDYRTNSQGRQQGLITSHCLGMKRCPSWVNKPRYVSGGGAGGGGGGGW